ncbi:unnamed protein product [Rotaria socialis]|uniref:TIR domain-containing protein n=1 Tax=Rotaria socialis TaxID=392032 RepID=A0A818RMH7_9BILA|nr:unnamed protein product [Rotaria socialis]CAF3659608.1 unnamed protein product [Rotaria socialis]CAF4415691.1 unnamed protein product [Rotaria socialis]CAF4475846.1 unnamed protein product [Rotaria socialis]
MATQNDEIHVPPIMVNQSHLHAITEDSLVDTLTADDICKMFDEFLTEFEHMEKSGAATTQVFLDAVEEITNAVLSVLPYKLLDPKVLSHQMVRFLHQMLIDLLENWQATDMRLNIQESDIFLKIILVFVRAIDHPFVTNPDEDRKQITKILETKIVLNLVREQIVDSNINKSGMNDDPNLCALGLLTIRLLRGCQFYYSNDRNIYLNDILIFNCLDSYDYVQALRQLQNGQSLNDIERFLLYTCWEHIPFSSKNSTTTAYSTAFIDQFYDDALARFELTLDQEPSMNSNALTYIFERCQQLLSIQNLPSFDKHANNILDRLTKALETPATTNPDGDNERNTVFFQALLNLSKNVDIRTIMKKRQLTSLFNKYASTEGGEQQKLALSILAEIMDESEINDNPTEMVKIFIDQLKELDPNKYNPDLDNTLSSLNAMIQHEEFKNEFIRQGGLEKLMAFVRDGDPEIQSDKQLEDAIKILWSCTFNNPEAVNTIKQDEKLMTRVADLLEKSKGNENTTLEKAAEGLIWKVEKEEKFIEERAAQAEKKKQEKKRKAQEAGVAEEDEEEEEEQKYDLMISYCWAESELAHRIFGHLSEKLGYKIWIDIEQMHGSTIEAMANAVDGAEFILMCMSESYKRSANCKSEAEYAFNRKKHIVPIKMKQEYVPDGWLGFILGTRLYIDFGTYEFEKAMKLLDSEIQLQKKKRKETKELAKIERAAAVGTSCDEKNDEEKKEVAGVKSSLKMKSNKGDISDWSEEKVQDFLMKHKLRTMIPLCNGINGEELYDLYSMCKANSSAMYRSLRSELLHGHSRILPIATYLRFMSVMRSVCDDMLLASRETIAESD